MQAVHFLITYQCTRACAHCFVWGDPNALATTMTGDQLCGYLDEVASLPDANMVFFEGGEPFLHYDLLLLGAQAARKRGLRWGVVSNGDWARSSSEALKVLEPLAELDLSSLTLSTDAYHSGQFPSMAICHAVDAAQQLGVPITVLATYGPNSAVELPPGLPFEVAWGSVMYRGRAAHRLAAESETHIPGNSCTTCPYEQLDAPSRVHLDAFGYVHLCQGLTVGRLRPGHALADLISSYQPYEHPIAGPLLAGGPRALALRYQPEALEKHFADSCHMCYQLRQALLERFPDQLGPPRVYGVDAK